MKVTLTHNELRFLEELSREINPNYISYSHVEIHEIAYSMNISLNTAINIQNELIKKGIIHLDGLTLNQTEFTFIYLNDKKYHCRINQLELV